MTEEYVYNIITLYRTNRHTLTPKPMYKARSKSIIKMKKRSWSHGGGFINF